MSTNGRSDYRRKILDSPRLERKLEDIRLREHPAAPVPTIVQCHGCFDIVHPGHIRYLQFAKMQGDLLIVSITGDASIDKQENRPYIPQELRAENLAALELVDYVVVDPNPTACEIIRVIKPDVYVKGHEYATSKDPGFLSERQLVESLGGRVIFSSGQIVFSSSRLIESMDKPDEISDKRLELVCRRHAIDRDRLAEFVDAIRGKRVLILGDTLVERYVLCDTADVAAESPMMSLNRLDQRDYIGGAGFLAVQAAALGAEPILVTAVGRDVRSDWALRELEAAGVQVRAKRHRPDLPIRTRFLADDHKLLRVNYTPVYPLDSVGERESAEVLLKHAPRTDAAIFYDAGCGVLTPGLIQRLGASFRRQVPVLVGGCDEQTGDLKTLRHTDLLVASERQLHTATHDYGSGLSSLAYQVMQFTQAKRMLAVLGKRGAVCFDRRSHDERTPAWNDRLFSEHLPSFSQRVLDQLGCMESMLAVGGLALAVGTSLMQAAYLACGVAAVQIAGIGPVPVNADALQHWIDCRLELLAQEEDELEGTAYQEARPTAPHSAAPKKAPATRDRPQ